MRYIYLKRTGLIFFIMMSFFQACTVFKRTEKMDNMSRERNLHMEQSIEGGPEATAEYFRETGKVFQQCIHECLSDISLKCFSKESCPETDDFQKAGMCYDSFFNSLKGGTNLSRQDVEQYIAGSADRYRRFFSFLDSLGNLAKVAGIEFEIIPPGKIYQDPYWDFGPDAGCNILVNEKVYLFAIPPCTAQTNRYMALQQQPVAASLIFMNIDCMLFINQDQDPEEAFFSSMGKLFSEGQNITGELENAYRVTLFPGQFIEIDSNKEPKYAEIEDFMKKYGILAVLTGNTGNFEASVHLHESIQHNLDIRK